MTTIEIGKGVPALCHEQRFAMNGQMPSAAALRRLVNGLNTGGAVLRRVTVIKTRTPDLLDWQAVLGGTNGLGLRTWWRGYIRTGEDCAGLVHFLGIARPGVPVGTPDPYVSIRNYNIDTAADLSTHTIRHNPRGPWPQYDSIADAEDIVTGVASNTQYGFFMNINDGCVPVYWSIGELASTALDDSGTITTNPAPFANDGPIYVQDIADAIQKATTIRKHNSSMLFTWSWRGGVVGTNNPRTLSAAYGPINAAGASPPNAATAGWSFDFTGRNTLLRDVPITFAALAYTGAGTTNNVRLVNQSGTALATLSGFGTLEAWKTVNVTIPATTTRLHVEYKSDGANILELLALGCVQYET